MSILLSWCQYCSADVNTAQLMSILLSWFCAWRGGWMTGHGVGRLGWGGRGKGVWPLINGSPLPQLTIKGLSCSSPSFSAALFLSPFSFANSSFYFPPCLVTVYLFSVSFFAVLRIRDVYPGFRIQDPTFFHPVSRIRIFSILDPVSASKNLSILTQKKVSKL